jgi:hypothetical protein
VFVPRGVPRPPDQVLRALALRKAGRSIPSIAAECDLPQGTVSRWCRGLLPADAVLLPDTGIARLRCERCGRDAHEDLPEADYSNRSSDIRRLFTDALDELGVEWRPWGRFHVSVARRRAVALLDAHVGPKT